MKRGEDQEPPGIVEDVDARSQIVSLQEEVDQLKDQLHELENQVEEHRRQNKQEHQDLRKNSVKQLAQDMIKVRDSLQRSLEIEQWNEDQRTKIQSLIKKFDTELTRNSVEKINPERGADFDVELHEAVKQVKIKQYGPDKIAKVSKAGFQIKENVIRPAKVVVTG